MSINEITTPTPIATIEDRTGGSLLDLQVGIEPVQNLNGYDAPYPLGGNGNYMPPGVATTVTQSGVTVKSDGHGVYTVSGTSTEAVVLMVDLTETFTIPASTDYNFLLKNSVANSSVSFRFFNDTTQIDTWALNSVNRVATSYSAMANKVCNKIGIAFNSGVTMSGTISPMFTLKATSTDTPFVAGSNICSITGFTEAKITRTGKNLLKNTTVSATVNGITFTVNSDGSVKANGTATANAYIRVSVDTSKVYGDLYFVALSGQTEATANAYMWDITTGARCKQWNGTSDATASYDGTFKQVKIVRGNNVAMSLRVMSGKTVSNLMFYPMICLPTETDTTWEPYYGTTYPISFSSAGTVYGGTLDVNSGVLTVDRRMDTYTASTATSSVTNTRGYVAAFGYQITIPDLDKLNLSITNSRVYSTKNIENLNINEYRFAPNAANTWCMLYIILPGITTATECNNYLASNPFQVCFYLATPITYQLTKTQVSTILNENNIWSDTGNINYLKGGYTFHDKLTSPATQNDAINKINELVDDYKDAGNAGMMSYTDKTKLNNTNVFYGTCSTAAGTAEKVVTLTNDTGFVLTPGTIIGVKYSYSNTATSVKLNVNNTGAKSIYQGTAVYTDKGAWITGTADAMLYYMFDGTYWVFFARDTYDGNTYDRTYLSNSGYKAKTAITKQNLIVADSNGEYFHLKTGNAFDITYPILYASSSVNAGATNNSGYLVIPFTITTTQSITLTAQKMVYIKGTLSGTTFTPVSTTPLTQTVPTTDDGYYYYSVGKATTTTVMYLYSEHPIYVYKSGAFREYVGYAETVVSKSGDTMDNNVIVTFPQTTATDTGISFRNDTTGARMWIGIDSGQQIRGIYDNKLNKWMVYATASNIYLNGTAANANKDGSGNNIVATYATITTVNGIDSRLQVVENGSGIATTTTWSTPTVSDSAITISEGGYYTEGRRCYVQMRFRLADALSANAGRVVATAMPLPKTTSAAILSIAVNNRGGHNIRVISDGRLQVVADVDHGISTTNDIDVTGCYTIQ